MGGPAVINEVYDQKAAMDHPTAKGPLFVYRSVG
jgi:hypothetical protein